MEVKDRIKRIIEMENLSQAEFSRVTEINTSTLSHVLTGRNNASIEVINKVLTAFPKYRSTWLINGEGEPLSASTASNASYAPPAGSYVHHNPTAVGLSLFEEETLAGEHSLGGINAPEDNLSADEAVLDRAGTVSPHYSQAVHPSIPIAPQQPKPEKVKVQKIIIYYDDNTFETFIPEKER